MTPLEDRQKIEEVRSEHLRENLRKICRRLDETSNAVREYIFDIYKKLKEITGEDVTSGVFNHLSDEELNKIYDLHNKIPEQISIYSLRAARTDSNQVRAITMYMKAAPETPNSILAKEIGIEVKGVKICEGFSLTEDKTVIKVKKINGFILTTTGESNNVSNIRNHGEITEAENIKELRSINIIDFIKYFKILYQKLNISLETFNEDGTVIPYKEASTNNTPATDRPQPYTTQSVDPAF